MRRDLILESLQKFYWLVAEVYISWDIALRWMSLDLTDDNTTLVQVMSLYHQATSHYLTYFSANVDSDIYHHMVSLGHKWSLTELPSRVTPTGHVIVTLVAIIVTFILVPDFIYGCPIFKWVAETWLHDRVPGLYCSPSSIWGCMSHFIRNAVECQLCHSNAVQYSKILHTSLQWWGQIINQRSNLQKSTHSSPVRGICCEYFGFGEIIQHYNVIALYILPNCGLELFDKTRLLCARLVTLIGETVSTALVHGVIDGQLTHWPLGNLDVI